MIYLDSNATTPVAAEVLDALRDCYLQQPANPASPHRAGQAARRVVEKAREQIGHALGARPDEVRGDRLVFTSGGTEANNLALLGRAHRPGRFLIAAIEHPSVTAAGEWLESQGREVHRLPVDARGVVQLPPLAAALAEQPAAMVALMLGNNETGVLQPVAEAVQLCRQSDVPLHTDAVQVVGKLPVDFRRLGVDSLTCTAHKLHGPAGIGALLIRSGSDIQPLHHGGFQQHGLRPGTETTALTVGFAKALQLAEAELSIRAARMRQLRDRFESQLREALTVSIIGHDAPRLPHTSCLAFPGLDRQALLLALDLAGVACSTGSACASGSSEPSPVLLAMGLPESVVAGALRFSLHAGTTAPEIDDAARIIIDTVRRLAATAVS